MYWVLNLNYGTQLFWRIEDSGTSGLALNEEKYESQIQATYIIFFFGHGGSSLLHVGFL